ncbi:MAG: tetratricopeptide repeat protein [Verrucomicrobiia bacterium]
MLKNRQGFRRAANRLARAAVCGLMLAGGVWCSGAAPAPPAKPKQPPAPKTIKRAPSRDPLQLTPDAQARAEAMAHYAAGHLYELRREPERALGEYEAALKLDPGQAELASKLGAEYLRRKQNDKALAVLTKAAAANPKRYEIQLLLGIAYQTVDKRDKATAAYTAASKLDPLQIGPYQSLAGCYLRDQKVADSLKTLERAFVQKSEDARYWATLGDLYALTIRGPDAEKAVKTVYKQKPKTDRAVECYEKAQKFAAEDLSVPFRLAGYYVMTSRPDQGIAIYKKLLEKRPDAIDVRERLAYAYAAKKEFTQGAAQIEEMVKRQPLNWQVYLLLGSFYEDSKMLDRAQANYEQALILNPKELQLYLRVARLQVAQKHPKEALQTLQRAKDRFPVTARVPYFHGLIYSNMKDYPKAVEAFAQAEAMAKARKEDKELIDSSFYFYYAAAAERSGKFDLATGLFRQSIKLNPENDEACNYLGYMFAEKSINLKEAEELVKRALKMQPKNGAFLDSLGWVYYRKGDYRKALESVSEAARSDAAKEDATVFEHLADIYLKLGKKDLAREQLRKGLEIDPKNKSVAEKLKTLGGDASQKKPAAPAAPAKP